MNIVRKISVKTIGADPKIGKTARTDLMEVLGVVRRYVTGESTFGEWIKLVGAFEATNLATGAVYTAPSCFMPSIVTEMVATEIDSNPNHEISFAFIVGVEPAATPIGYAYYVESLIEPKPIEALASLRELVGSDHTIMNTPTQIEAAPKAHTTKTPKQAARESAADAAYMD